MPAPAPSLPATPSAGLLPIPDLLLKWPDLYTQPTLAAQLDEHGGITTPLSRTAIMELFAVVASVFSSTLATAAQLRAGRTLLDDVMARIIAAAPLTDPSPTPPHSVASSPAASKQSFKEGVSSGASARRGEGSTGVRANDS